MFHCRTPSQSKRSLGDGDGRALQTEGEEGNGALM